MQCPYYIGTEERGKDKGIRCTKGFLLLMSDEKIKESLKKRCIGESERDHCRPFLFRQLEEIGMQPASDMDTENDLRRMYLEKMSESGTAPQKEEKPVDKKCGTCNFGHWYSDKNTYTSVVQDDGIHTIQRPCEPHTHYCYQFTEGQRKIADDAHFAADSAPDWCPLRHAEETENENVESGAAPLKEENSMSEELEKTEQVEVSSRREYAERLHNEILHNADMVSSYLVELCKDLKRMRDERYYTELGYDTFDDYAEKDVGIKKRQAYTYISAYEKLGDTFLQSNAKLGITRLALLTEVPAADRPDFAEENDLANMSTREIKALVEKTKQQGEQLSLLTDERDSAKAAERTASEKAETAQEDKAWEEAHRKDAERLAAEAQARADAMAAELEKLKNAEPDEAALVRLKKQAERDAKKDLAEKIKAAEEKAATAARAEEAKKLQAAREEAEKSAAERIKQGLAAVEQKKTAALQRAAELEKQLKVSGNKDTVMFSFLFSEEQELVNKMNGLILKIEPTDAEMAEKLRGALKQMLGQQMEALYVESKI